LKIFSNTGMDATDSSNQAVSRFNYFSHCITVKKAFNSPIFPWLLVILWAAAIFLLSNNPDPYGLLPEKIYQWVYKTHITGIRLTKILGLLGHMVQFGILAVLLVRALAWPGALSPRHVWLSILLSVLYGLTDEIHQIFIPGRAFQWLDLFMDSLGILLGLSLYVFVQFLHPKAQEQQPLYE